MTRSEKRINPVSDRLSQLEDDELVRIAKFQLPYVTAAYEALFHRYHSKLLQMCYRYLGSTEEAEEAVNDAMLNMFNCITQFEERASFKTWIYKIAHNQALTRLRKKQVEQVEFDESHETVVEVKDTSQEQRKHLDILLQSLTIEERAIVVFRITSDLEFNDIALVVDQKLSTVKMRYKRALEKMSNLAQKTNGN